MLAKQFEFPYNRQMLMCEVEFTTAINPDEDGVVVIGEISNNEGDVFEVPNKTIMAEFKNRFWDEIEDERQELVYEKSSKLSDFTGTVRMPVAKEDDV